MCILIADSETQKEGETKTSHHSFHNFQKKEKVILEVRKWRAKLQYVGKPITFSEDYPP